MKIIQSSTLFTKIQYSNKNIQVISIVISSFMLLNGIAT